MNFHIKGKLHKLKHRHNFFQISVYLAITEKFFKIKTRNGFNRIILKHFKLKFIHKKYISIKSWQIYINLAKCS